jgi:adenine-specific DNA-methyltransferase
VVIAAAKHKRRGIGIDQSHEYIELARSRLAEHQAGRIITRAMGKPVRRPKAGERVATIPSEWKSAAE